MIFWITLIITFGYATFWIIVDYYFQKKDDTINPSNEKVFCSIIICAYNEERKIEKCLMSIISQDEISNYAEILIVDDGSTDNTIQIAKSVLEKSKIPFQIISNEKNTGKKRSIEKAIEHSIKKSEWIILRDADTFTLSNNWFKKLHNKMNNKNDLIIAPVITFIEKKKILAYLQYFEGLALMSLTKGSLNLNKPILCNAANMAFRKETFLKLQPYKTNYQLPTGDDIFILQKFKSANCKITSCFSNDSIVYTYPPKKIESLYAQKSRWLSKTTIVNDYFNTFSGILISAMNILLLLIFTINLNLFVKVFIIKILVDFIILYTVQKHLKLKEINPFYFLIAEIGYIPYVCALIFQFLFLKKLK
jgi:cellulose synthase/poly-beta-1,6-N-acetylglucosamine synthase-like glycosyltransferase